MAIPSPSTTNPILYRERKVWIKGVDAALLVPVSLTQLPAALVGGRLDVNIGASIALDVSDRAARLVGKTRLTDNTTDTVVKAASTRPAATDPSLVVGINPNSISSDQGGMNAAAAGVAVTLTLAAPGAGLFQYLTKLTIFYYATAATVGAAAPVVVTTTNLPATPAFDFPTAMAIGTQVAFDWFISSPIKASTANTAVTIVCPAVVSMIWRVYATYFIAG